MKVETQIGSRAGLLEVEGDMLRYTETSGVVVSGNFSVEPLDSGCYSVLFRGRSFRVSRSAGGEMLVDGVRLPVEVFDPRELRGRKTKGLDHGRAKISAPMPGKVVRLMVAVGDMVEAGQDLAVVEAMKMQNAMKSPKTGRVSEVKTQVDATVGAGDVLVVVE